MIMDLSFFPSRQNMYKEVQLWIALNKLEMLLGLCNCCTYKVFGCTSAHQCRSCHVRNGILKLTKQSKREPVDGEELLGVC
jgi:hypothetical protein